MSVQTQIDRIETAKADIKTAIEGKGVTVPSTTKIDGMAALIGTITGGEDVSAETAEYTSQLDKLESTIDTLPDAGSGGGSVETCTVAGYGFEGNCYYSDGTQVVEDAESFYYNNPLSVAKNSILCFKYFQEIPYKDELSIYGDGEVLYSLTSGFAIAIYGDCEIETGDGADEEEIPE